MKISEIRKKFLKWAVPFTVGKVVDIPVYRRVSTTHDPRNSGYKQSWEPGKARVTSIYCERERGQVRFSVIVNHNACSVRWIGVFRSDRFYVQEKERGDSLIGVAPMKYATPNDDLFTKAWAKKLCDRLNAFDKADGKIIKEIRRIPKVFLNPHKIPTIKAKACKCKACKCGKAKARKTR